MQTQLRTGIYRDFKGNFYEVIGVARRPKTLQPVVVYRELCAERVTWVKPIAMFSAKVKTHDGQTVRRFQFVENVTAEALKETAKQTR